MERGCLLCLVCGLVLLQMKRIGSRRRGEGWEDVGGCRWPCASGVALCISLGVGFLIGFYRFVLGWFWLQCGKGLIVVGSCLGRYFLNCQNHLRLHNHLRRLSHLNLSIFSFWDHYFHLPLNFLYKTLLSNVLMV